MKKADEKATKDGIKEALAKRKEEEAQEAEEERKALADNKLQCDDEGEQDYRTTYLREAGLPHDHIFPGEKDISPPTTTASPATLPDEDDQEMDDQEMEEEDKEETQDKEKKKKEKEQDKKREKKASGKVSLSIYIFTDMIFYFYLHCALFRQASHSTIRNWLN